MHNAANFRVTTIQREMGRGVGGGLFTPLDHFTRGDIYHHHIFCVHHVVLHAGWFDHHHAAGTVNRADVAPGERHQLVGGQGEICRQHLGFELF